MFSEAPCEKSLEFVDRYRNYIATRVNSLRFFLPTCSFQNLKNKGNGIQDTISHFYKGDLAQCLTQKPLRPHSSYAQVTCS